MTSRLLQDDFKKTFRYLKDDFTLISYLELVGSQVCHRFVSGLFKLSLSPAQSYSRSLKYFVLFWDIMLRMALKEFLQHSKVSRGGSSLGQASMQVSKHAGKQVGKHAGKHVSQQTSRQALRGHSVRAMPCRGKLFKPIKTHGPESNVR